MELGHSIGRGAAETFHQLADGGRDDRCRRGFGANLFDFAALAFDDRGQAQYVVMR
jgi:hypothetical protein